METMKETAATIQASAISGLEKTKAVIQEKVEKMSAHDPLEKEMAETKKQDRIEQAEIGKRQAMGGGTYSHSVTGDTGKPTGAKQMSALPGHGTGEPTGNVVEGVVQSHPIGVATGTGRPAAAHNTNVGAATKKDNDTGGGYSIFV